MIPETDEERQALADLRAYLGWPEGKPLDLVDVLDYMAKFRSALQMANQSVQRRTQWLREALGEDQGVPITDLIRRVCDLTERDVTTLTGWAARR